MQFVRPARRSMRYCDMTDSCTRIRRLLDTEGCYYIAAIVHMKCCKGPQSSNLVNLESSRMFHWHAKRRPNEARVKISSTVVLSIQIKDSVRVAAAY